MRNLYTLHSVFVHSGGVEGVHCYVFIRPTLSYQWYKFDDERVTKVEVERALHKKYRGDQTESDACIFFIITRPILLKQSNGKGKAKI